MDICVTGASKGLGFALTTAFLGCGHRVWAVARTTESLLELEKQSGGKLFVSRVDISSDQSVQEWSAAIRERGFKSEIVVLNASVQKDDVSDDALDVAKSAQNIEVNLIGTLRCVSAFLPLMLTVKRGSFIAISSTVCLRPSVRSVGYGASKAGLEMAFRALRLKHAASGIRFASVILGPISTEMWEGKQSPFVPSPKKAAGVIVPFALSGGTHLYFPWLSTTLLRLSLWLPDRLFAFVSGKVLK